MTKEEAIRLLDPETTAEAIAEIEYYVGFGGKKAAIHAIYDACILAVDALKAQIEFEPLLEEMKKRNITAEHLKEYMIFEDDCVKKGFTFKSLLEARERMEPKKPILKETEKNSNGRDFKRAYCPCCDSEVYNEFHCEGCGQNLDWGEDE